VERTQKAIPLRGVEPLFKDLPNTEVYEDVYELGDNILEISVFEFRRLGATCPKRRFDLLCTRNRARQYGPRKGHCRFVESFVCRDGHSGPQSSGTISAFVLKKSFRTARSNGSLAFCLGRTCLFSLCSPRFSCLSRDLGSPLWCKGLYSSLRPLLASFLPPLRHIPRMTVEISLGPRF